MTSLYRAVKLVFRDFLPSRRRWQASAVVGLMLLGGLAELVTITAVLPLLILMIRSDGGSGSGNTAVFAILGIEPISGSLPFTAALFCAVVVVAAMIRIVLAWASQKLVYRIGNDLGVSLYERMLYQPYKFHVAINSSRILSDINNIQKTMSGVFLPMTQGVSALVIVLFILVGLVLINWAVALTTMLFFGAIYTVASRATTSKLRTNSDTIAAASRKRIKAMQEGLGSIRDVLIDNSQPVYVRKFARLDNQLRNAQVANAFIAVTPRFIIEALAIILIVVLAMVLHGLHGGLADYLPVLAAMALGGQRLLPLLQQIYSAWAQLMGNRAMLLNIVELLKRPLPERFAMRESIVPVTMSRSITLERVRFRYSDDGPDVLRDISIDLPRGSRVGLVGKSGSGKSTLIDLIMGLLQPTGGSILIDGMELNESNVLGWQKQVAHVPQNIFLADGSILENIALGIPTRDVDENRVRAACRQAELEDYIETLPDRYKSVVGERGIRLSGGQRQRLGIARALYKRSSVLILDEATSAVDDMTEASVIDSVQRLGRDCTVLMIAHRVTTLQCCDIIFRLENGRIIEQGSYSEVIGRGFGAVAAFPLN